MRIVLISHNLLLHNQWKKALKSSDEIVSLYGINEINSFDFKEKDITILDYDNMKDYLDLLNRTKIICLSSNLDNIEGYKLLKEKGVKAYGNNYMTPFNLKNVIETVNSGSIWVYPELMSFIILNSSLKTQNIEETNISKLTKRELDVAKEVSKGFSNKEISNNLDITERTVKAHISSCFSKLEIKDRVSLGVLIKDYV